MNLFVVQTPYHLLLAHAIAPDLASGESTALLIVGDFHQAECYTESMRQCDDHPFDQVHYLPGEYGLTTWDEIGKQRQENVRWIKDFLAQASVANLVVFNDFAPESQAAYHYAQAANPNLAYHFGEDGACMYGNHRYPTFSPERTESSRHCYGEWWEPVEILGSSDRFDTVFAIAPALVRPECSRKTVRPISREALFDTMRTTAWPGKLLELLQISLSDYAGLHGIVIFAHSSFAAKNPGYTDVYATCLRFARDGDIPLAYKYHPRESVAAYMATFQQDAPILPREIPIEMLAVMAPELCECLIGDVSTSLLVIKWAYADARVLSIAPMLAEPDQRLISAFQQQGITTLNHIAELPSFFGIENNERLLQCCYENVDMLMCKNIRLETASRAQQQQTTEMADAFAALERSHAAVTQAYATLEHSCAELAQAYTALEHGFNDLRTGYETIIASKAWKLTTTIWQLTKRLRGHK